MSSQPDGLRLLLTVRQAAEALAISERKLWSLTKGGRLPHIKIGSKTLYPVETLQQWIHENTRHSA